MSTSPNPSSSSSTSNLWATASKEWVIQPKPKPGRKPKKDAVSPAKADSETETKGRRVQNRAAQRAFRERKQSQLSELQARIQSYEQGEMERTVALQNIAKRLKEENDKLREENLSLQTKLLQMQQHQQLQVESTSGETDSQEGPEKKRRKKSPSHTLPTENPSTKKARNKPDSDLPLSVPSIPSLSFPLSVSSTTDSNGTADSHFSPMSYETHSGLEGRSFEQFNGLASDPKDMEVNLPPFASFGCGFCSEDTICVCQEMAVAGHNPTEYKSDDHDFGNIASIPTGENMEGIRENGLENGQGSILDNLPPYQPPVALRRRPGAAQVNSIFPVRALQERLDATCSGDPSNCLACGDDAFGKAFCVEIGKKVAMRPDFEGCPCQNNSRSEGGCCGTKSSASGCGNCSSSSIQTTDESAELMPTNDAWRKLKAHPNIEFADLSLLAEVVSSRSKCLGPRLVVSPAPQLPPNSVRGIDELSPDLDRYTHSNGRNSPSLRLVPQEVLLECGRKRVRQVYTTGVQDALRLLDAKFS